MREYVPDHEELSAMYAEGLTGGGGGPYEVEKADALRGIAHLRADALHEVQMVVQEAAARTPDAGVAEGLKRAAGMIADRAARLRDEAPLGEHKCIGIHCPDYVEEVAGDGPA